MRVLRGVLMGRGSGCKSSLWYSVCGAYIMCRYRVGLVELPEEFGWQMAM